MKQTIFKITCCLVAAFIVFCSFAVPSFATDSNIVEFPLIPVTSADKTAVASNGLTVGSDDNGNFNVGSNVDGVYLFLTNTNQDNSSSYYPDYGYYTYYAISENASSAYRVKVYFSGSSTSLSTTVLSQTTLDGLTYYYKKIDSDTLTPSSGIPWFSSIEDAFTAFDAFLSSPPVSPSPNYDFTTPVDVEPGTVLYVGVNAGQTLTLSGTTRFPYRSSLLSGNFPDSSQRLAQVSSLPSGDVQFPLSNSISIPWVKADPLNILGQSFNAQFSADALANSSILSFSDNGFLTIYNPYFVNVEHFNDAGGLNENSTLHLNISGYSSLRTYSIQDEILHGSNPDGYDKSWAGNITDNGNGTGSVSWEAESASGADTSSMSSSPSNSNYNGGGVPSSESIIQGIANTLTNFTNSLISLVSSPISHINQLISSGSGFMNGLRGLYSWLPGDIQSHLVSALTLVITIGVFKVFL